MLASEPFRLLGQRSYRLYQEDGAGSRAHLLCSPSVPLCAAATDIPLPVTGSSSRSVLSALWPGPFFVRARLAHCGVLEPIAFTPTQFPIWCGDNQRSPTGFQLPLGGTRSWLRMSVRHRLSKRQNSGTFVQCFSVFFTSCVLGQFSESRDGGHFFYVHLAANTLWLQSASEEMSIG